MKKIVILVFLFNIISIFSSVNKISSMRRYKCNNNGENIKKDFVENFTKLKIFYFNPKSKNRNIQTLKVLNPEAFDKKKSPEIESYSDCKYSSFAKINDDSSISERKDYIYLWISCMYDNFRDESDIPEVVKDVNLCYKKVFK